MPQFGFKLDILVEAESKDKIDLILDAISNVPGVDDVDYNCEPEEIIEEDPDDDDKD